MGNKVTVFKPSGGYQTWDNNFPTTPIQTEQYPYQAITLQDTGSGIDNWFLLCSTTPIYNYYSVITTKINWLATSSGSIKLYIAAKISPQEYPTSWVDVTEGNRAYGDGIQANYNVTGDFPFAATIEQIYDYGALPTPFRVKNLRHFNSAFLQSRTARIKKSYSEYVRCNL